MLSLQKTSGFSKLLPFNNPKSLLVIAIVASLTGGAAQPIFAIFFSKVLAILTPDIDLIEKLTHTGYVLEECSKYCLWMFLVACASGFSSFSQKYSFGILGTNVTLKIREVLYDNILQKDIGWFDLKENGSSVLTSTMASDTSLINGVSTESLGPSLESYSSMAIGLIIGFVYCWQESVVCLCVSPIMIVA